MGERPRGRPAREASGNPFRSAGCHLAETRSWRQGPVGPQHGGHHGPAIAFLFQALITLCIKADPTVASLTNLNLSIGTNLNSSPAEDQPSIAFDLFWGGDNWSVL